MQSKEEILTVLRDEFDRWDQLLRSLTEQQIVARVLPSDLSIKDVVAHLHAWQKLSIARLEAAVQSDEPSYRLTPEALNPDAEENLERINAWIHKSYHDRPWTQVYRDWRDGYLHLIELGRSLPEEDLLKPGKYTWMPDAALASVLDGSYDHHHVEHYVPLTEWLREKGFRGEEGGRG